MSNQVVHVVVEVDVSHGEHIVAVYNELSDAEDYVQIVRKEGIYLEVYDMDVM